MRLRDYLGAGGLVVVTRMVFIEIHVLSIMDSLERVKLQPISVIIRDVSIHFILNGRVILGTMQIMFIEMRLYMI